MAGATNWHKLLGMLLTDLLAGSPFVVEVEKDLSFKSQRLDILIVRKTEGEVTVRLPDGLDGHLTAHNLLSFKSFQDTLNPFAIKELLGHSVNYAKQNAPSSAELLPGDQMRLFAVSARFPDGLAKQVPLTEVGKGVYDCQYGADVIRVVVLSRLPQQEQNAVLLLLSANEEQRRYASEAFVQRDPATSTFITRLLQVGEEGGPAMEFKSIDDYRREFGHLVLQKMTPEERLKGLDAEEILKAVPPEVREALLRARPDAGPKEESPSM